ncbi:MAG: hypothetical protein A4E54_00563 [Pelotomaculum sp. PtaB.Bin117]|nr:MAG: hypothetical protein A4E54_00563 [Pelotomaculum sp. PtaB.Bin117]OPY62101.1 MAG: hypothetical protein A4E56_01595 [Pelotomaculum sp. PtaU1.Bin065]
MEQLTQMELLQLEELLRAEELAVKKSDFFADNCQDADLKKIFQESSRVHQGHLDGLLGQLRSLNGKTATGGSLI